MLIDPGGSYQGAAIKGAATIDTGGDIMEAPGIDQSDWSRLEQFDSLAGRTAHATYEDMEWEWAHASIGQCPHGCPSPQARTPAPGSGAGASGHRIRPCIPST
ncbi:hypothetical protein [Roseovarius sp. D22-M7]|uniref:hypothetical protein n=1 Tax=Roseovarius sp. D22-M7 TaxID=3127116 RepID=UPI00300F8F37